ncbi:methyltransferase family protein [Novosphingopyxis sp.]|uniref:methyltransferase family protein n=1 Tax=Novosphingopyxis sp. TaxID=2709690 RepID=UPI003B5A68E0
MNDSAPSASPRPVSAVSYGVGLCGVAGLALWVVAARQFGALAGMLGFAGLPERADGPYAALLGVLACGLPMVGWSLFVDKVHRRASTGIDWSLRRPLAEVLDISIVKIAGYWATWALIAAIYALGRFWWTTQYANYPFSMALFETALIPLIILSVPYIVWLDRYLIDARDGAWHFGAWIAGREGWDKAMIHHHLRAWAVKGFFLAFMLSIVPGGFQQVVNYDVADVARNPVWIANALITTMFLVDVQLATVGYLLTMKPLDSHIRTANPYLAGWLAALICYPPFTLMNTGGPLDYHVATSDWAMWFAGQPALLAIWGALLVILTGVYAFATVAFGLRFSNLTHRGILTHGPYAWTRHPAYVSKNAYWWLATLPFIVTSGSAVDAVRNTALLGITSAVYYWRARTEEKHLLADPVYREYYDWAEDHAAWPRLLRKLSGGRIGKRGKMGDGEVVAAE